ncbi:Oidioi.mRNA.OKI2018_I69.chr1.g398.t1.cds [Oikopleura dioica]|uniref:Oidioi.mRNA.OKI2018_I69.chr1.g398.t1.cds n=1 Tax=Oikopleura dioica TaxID=34765 RepID=A0ABN7SJQ1_OIKDI|nr:Oidioi.mRNA.OKI2018_I69.chr1.g398.t1.cds [Oikopleura dioica]
MKEEENCTNERSGQEKDVSLIDTDQELVDDGQLLGQGQVSIDIDVPLLDTNERQRNEEEQNDDQEVNTPSTEENSKKCCSKECKIVTNSILFLFVIALLVFKFVFEFNHNSDPIGTIFIPILGVLTLAKLLHDVKNADFTKFC